MLQAGVSVRCSSPRAHRALIAFRPAFPTSCSCRSFGPAGGRRLLSCPNIINKRTDIERSRPAKRPRECPATYSLLEAHVVGMQIRAPARQPPTGIGNYCVPDHHQAKQFRFGLAAPASHTGAYDAGRAGRPFRGKSTAPGCLRRRTWGPRHRRPH